MFSSHSPFIQSRDHGALGGDVIAESFKRSRGQHIRHFAPGDRLRDFRMGDGHLSPDALDVIDQQHSVADHARIVHVEVRVIEISGIQNVIFQRSNHRAVQLFRQHFHQTLRIRLRQFHRQTVHRTETEVHRSTPRGSRSHIIIDHFRKAVCHQFRADFRQAVSCHHTVHDILRAVIDHVTEAVKGADGINTFRSGTSLPGKALLLGIIGRQCVQKSRHIVPTQPGIHAGPPLQRLEEIAVSHIIGIHLGAEFRGNDHNIPLMEIRQGKIQHDLQSEGGIQAEIDTGHSQLRFGDFTVDAKGCRAAADDHQPCAGSIPQPVQFQLHGCVIRLAVLFRQTQTAAGQNGQRSTNHQQQCQQKSQQPEEGSR